jgi:glycosyltransferase involved in cell wall biosynthesis
MWDAPFVANLTQDMVMRGESCGLQYYLAATDGLPAMPAGKGSELLPGGIGILSYEGVHFYLAGARCYIYTGTRPASYTLGLLEANLSGVPTVVIGKRAWGGEWGGEDLWDMWGADAGWEKLNDPAYARKLLKRYLDDPELARRAGERARQNCIKDHDVAVVGQQWREFLA